ncbi:hypothetical protein HK104_000301 [Borealophlyctis nickersoniae]|nr:hypothetical protein HK104_000301 [Borealophlyctis nickersoniae]
MHITQPLILATLATALPALAAPAPAEVDEVALKFPTKKWVNPCPTKNGKYVGPNAKKCFPLIIDADEDSDDTIAVLYALKVPYADIRGMAVPGTGWGHGAAAANLVDFADKVRPGSNIPVSIGTGVNLYESDLAALLASQNATDPNPGCKYQRAVPEGFTGRVDSDLLFGLQYMVPRSTRKWRDLRNYKPVEKSLEEWIVSSFEQTGKKVTIFISGPGTDLALALRTTPTLHTKIERVVWMGGAIDVPGNLFPVPQNTVAEFNIYIDCVASQELFSNPNLNITLVPLDFTNHLVLGKEFFSALKKISKKTWESNFVYNFLSIIKDTWFGGEEAFFKGYTIWDPLALAVMFDQAGKVTFEDIKIKQVCNTADLRMDGKTQRAPKGYKGANVRVAKTLETGKTITDYPVVKSFFAALTA